jgi:hypothetical protein
LIEEPLVYTFSIDERFFYQKALLSYVISLSGSLIQIASASAAPRTDMNPIESQIKIAVVPIAFFLYSRDRMIKEL